MHRFAGWACLITALTLLPSLATGQGTASGSGAAATTAPAATATAPAAGSSSTAAVGAETASGASAAGDATGAAAAGDKGNYSVRLKDLEDRVNRLKEQIFRSKARLSLLAETVLDRKIAGAKAVISFRNEMGGSFWLTKATFLLDGGPILNKTDEGGNLAERDVIELFDGPVMPGDHTLSVVLQYRGHGYGIFSYLKGYSFKVRSSRTFTVSEGKAIKVEVIGYEKGGVTTALEERPAVRFAESLADFEGAATAEAEDKAPPSSSGDEGAEGAGSGEGTE
jgi:3-oxoacyl-ACP reductase-like protein